MALDMTSFDAALKAHYVPQTIENLVYPDNPLLAMLPKYKNFRGRNLPIVVQWKNGGGRSATISVAYANAGNALGVEDFVLTRVSDHCWVNIDAETILASEGDENAFMEAVTAQIDGIIGSLTRAVARDVYRAGWGELGVIGSINSATVTLATISDVVNFEVGDVCVLADSLSGSTLRNSGAGLTVASVDRYAGTVTFSAAVSTESGAVGDYIFTKGDRQNSATPTRLKIAGLAAWGPTSAPSATAFFGVDRSQDSRLAFARYAPASGEPLNEALISAANLVAREGGRLTHFFVHPDKYSELIKLLDGKVQYVEQKVAEVGFEGVRVHGIRGTFEVFADHNCPYGLGYGLDMKSIKLYTIGEVASLWDLDGTTMLRQSQGDGVEVRAHFRGQLGCNAPCHNVVVSFA